MSNALLVLNAGSSSIKFALFPLAAEIVRRPALSGQIDGIGEGIGAGPGAALTAVDGGGQAVAHRPLSDCHDHHRAIALLFQWLDQHGAHDVAAVGHRVVHGGVDYHEPLLIDDASLAALARLIPLAPLQQPHNLEAIRALRRLRPDLPQVACFDTAFHRSQPPLAQAFALPRAISAQGIRRYGFHGLSYEYIAQILPEHMGERADSRVVVAHLGNGASMCAMKERKSTATTMGFTALDGLMMGTRCGNLDPGVLLYLMEQQGMDAGSLSRLLYHQSGLLGVSGISQDMRELLASDQAAAKEAVDLFCYRIARELGSLAPALGGLDALVFTGGIGEHAAPVREAVCADARWLGVKIDTAANSADAARISAAGSGIEVLVLPTNEEWMVARHTARRIGQLQ